MEGKSVLNSIAIFCLALSIVIGSWLISRGLSSEKSPVSSKQEHLLTQQQIASYLGLSEKDIGYFMSRPGYSIDGEIPHIRIGNKNYFDKEAVTKWIQQDSVFEVP